MILKKLVNYFILGSLLLPAVLKSQITDPPFLKFLNHPWVDSVMKTLTTEQKIAQCIWVAGYSDRDISHEAEISEIIRNYSIGGIVFFQGTAEKQAELTNYYQKITKVPLLIAMDAEWGIGMRLENIEKFPFQMTLGALQNDSLIYEMGHAVALQCKRLGVHINFAPVADINNNPLNPVINYRSFGEDKYNVTGKALMYMRGLQDNGIHATLKHFPGHGDTNTDSHFDLPVINNTRSRLDSLELFPFMSLIKAGASSVMTAHINLPLIDTLLHRPSSLSPVIINDILKNDIGFKGLVISDAMNMKGITRYYNPGIAEAMALAAGNDVVEFTTDVNATIRETLNLLNKKVITAGEIDHKCRKILAAKYWSGLSENKPITGNNIVREISTPSNSALIHDLYAGSITVLTNEGNIIPVRQIQGTRIAAISIGKEVNSFFQKRISSYFHADNYSIDPSDRELSDDLLNKLKGYDLVIAGIFGTDQRPNTGFGIKPGLEEFLSRMINNNKTIITYFGNPYAIDRLNSLQGSHGLILAYQENDHTEDLAAQIIFGGLGAHGFLPVSINNRWKSGYGIITPGNIRLRYGFPENAGLSSLILEHKTDSIVNSGLDMKAFPCCEIMIARKGIVVFQKSYGYHTYDRRIELRDEDLFDISSMTKISATLPGLMLLDGEGSFSPENKLYEYLPEFRRTDKGDLILKDMLAHQAGLVAWIPFWKNTMNRDSVFKRRIIRSYPSEKFPYLVADNIYINRNYKKEIFREIGRSPLGEKKYLYSDLPFILAPVIIERITGKKWYDFVEESIYDKMGINDICFNPYLRYPPERIVPTEYDTVFRKQLLHGTVHDEGAALMGGISGHAGLFATAGELMKILEMYRRKGSYGGESIIAENIIEKYTEVQFPENNNRRGLGFDKPLLDNSEVPTFQAYPAKSASPGSYGHSGFTGCFAWVDPEYEINYIFLCNRVFPTRNNNLLTENNIRTNILQAIYDSIIIKN